MPKKMDFSGIFLIEAAVDLPSVGANTTAEVSVTLADVRATDELVGVRIPATLNAGLSVIPGRVSAAKTVVLRIVNSTAGALDAASATFGFHIGRR